MLGWDHIGDTCIDELVMTFCFAFSVTAAFIYLLTADGGNDQRSDY